MARPPRIDRKVKRDRLDRVKVREVKDATGKIKRPGGKNASNLITRRRKVSSVRPGMQLGDLYIHQRVNTKKGSSGGQKWLCECSCGERLVVPQWYLVRKEFPKRHCGCRVQARSNSNTRERGIFYMMHRRCYNPTHVAYKHYGGAPTPIGVGDSWNKDVVGNEAAWENFQRDMGSAPTKGHTLDRIDPYKGYGWQPRLDDPEDVYLNCRWATAKEQMNNLKKHWLSPAERAAKLEAEKFDVDPDESEGLPDETESDEEPGDAEGI
jgi:hypothetical protein